MNAKAYGKPGRERCGWEQPLLLRQLAVAVGIEVNCHGLLVLELDHRPLGLRERSIVDDVTFADPALDRLDEGIVGAVKSAPAPVAAIAQRIVRCAEPAILELEHGRGGGRGDLRGSLGELPLGATTGGRPGSTGPAAAMAISTDITDAVVSSVFIVTSISRSRVPVRSVPSVRLYTEPFPYAIGLTLQTPAQAGERPVRPH